MAYIASLSSCVGARDSSSNAALKALGAMRDLQEVATQKNHRDIVSLGMILELRELMANGMWQKVYEALKNTEEQLNIAGEIDVAEKTSVDSASPSQESGSNHMTLLGDTNLKKVLIVHALVIGTLFYTYVGDNTKAQSRMKKLHESLDCGALDAFGKSGIVTVGFPGSPSLDIQVTHPRIVYALGFLVSSVAKRDPVGRKPKRRVFAQEGTLSVERELRKEVSCTLCCSITKHH